MNPKFPVDPVPTTADKQALAGRELATMARYLGQVEEYHRPGRSCFASRARSPRPRSGAAGTALPRPEAPRRRAHGGPSRRRKMAWCCSTRLSRRRPGPHRLDRTGARPGARQAGELVHCRRCLDLQCAGPDAAPADDGARRGRAVESTHHREQADARILPTTSSWAASISPRCCSGSGGSYELALAAYNAGPNRVARWIEGRWRPAHRQDRHDRRIEMMPFRENAQLRAAHHGSRHRLSAAVSTALSRPCRRPLVGHSASVRNVRTAPR